MAGWQSFSLLGQFLSKFSCSEMSGSHVTTFQKQKHNTFIQNRVFPVWGTACPKAACTFEPLLFDLCINDIVQTKLIVYTDDTSLFFRASNIVARVLMVRETLNEVHKWSTVNLLPINTSETKAIFFVTRGKPKMFFL